MKSLLVALATLALLAMAGCTAQTQGSKDADHQNICQVDDWGYAPVAKVCKPGQKVVFLPQRWGNEQLPIKFAAVNCDLGHSVVMNNGGVTCIYRPIKPTEAKPE